MIRIETPGEVEAEDWMAVEETEGYLESVGVVLMREDTAEEAGG